MFPDNGAISAALGFAVAIIVLFLFRIPQSAIAVAQGFRTLDEAKDKRISDLEKDMAEVRADHNECERRYEELERNYNRLASRLARLES